MDCIKNAETIWTIVILLWVIFSQLLTLFRKRRPEPGAPSPEEQPTPAPSRREPAIDPFAEKAKREAPPPSYPPPQRVYRPQPRRRPQRRAPEPQPIQPPIPSAQPVPTITFTPALWRDSIVLRAVLARKSLPPLPRRHR